jgi:hypothetical protein
MSEKIIKPEKLLARIADTIDQRITELLWDRDIYNIHSIGWENETDPDQEYYIYAQWEINPLADVDLDSLENENNTPPKNSNSCIDIEKTIHYHDFIETMDKVFLTFGQALFFNKLEKEEQAKLNIFNTSILLNIASDRIRDFYALTLTGDKYKKWRYSTQDEKKRYERRHYYSLFKEAFEYFRNNSYPKNGVISHAIKALKLANSISRYRCERNDSVHELANDWAKSIDKVLRYQRQLKIGINAFKNFDNNTNEDKIKDLKKWYYETIDLGNNILNIEYLIRNTASSVKL